MTLRLQLHVGHGKTGSSYLQSWLAANASVLLDQHQLLYPQQCPFTRARDSRAEQGQFSMGNGFVLNPVLEDGVRWRRQQHRQAVSVMPGIHEVITGGLAGGIRTAGVIGGGLGEAAFGAQ